MLIGIVLSHIILPFTSTLPFNLSVFHGKKYIFTLGDKEKLCRELIFANLAVQVQQ